MATPHDTVCGVVLAGGRSRRMGQPKQTLTWPDARGDRITWLDHARRRLSEVCAVVRVSGEEDLPDTVPDQPGPLAGIAAALETSPASRCLFLPVDMPLVTRAELVPLLEAQTPHAAYQGSLFPLCLQVSAATLAQVRRRLAHPAPGQRSVHLLLRDFESQVTWLRGSEARLRNINSPEELASVSPSADTELKENTP